MNRLPQQCECCALPGELLPLAFQFYWDNYITELSDYLDRKCPDYIAGARMVYVFLYFYSWRRRFLDTARLTLAFKRSGIGLSPFFQICFLFSDPCDQFSDSALGVVKTPFAVDFVPLANRVARELDDGVIGASDIKFSVASLNSAEQLRELLPKISTKFRTLC